MNINQLLFISLLLYLFLYYCNSNHLYEGFDENKINQCLSRIINNECLDKEKKIEINRDCGTYTIGLKELKVKLSCDDKVLTDTLLCKKMELEGACDSNYGRKQMRGICYDPPINIKCPVSFDSKNSNMIQKIQDVEKKLQKCEKKDKKVYDIPEKETSECECECECNGYMTFKKYAPLVFIIISVVFIFKKNRKK